MLKISEEELMNKIRKHEKWLNGDVDGEQLVLIGYDISDVDLSNKNISKSWLKKSKFDHVNLHNANLYKSYISESIFYKSDLSNANIQFAHIVWDSLEYTDLHGTIFTNSSLVGSYFKYCNLRWANLDNTDVDGCNFAGSKLIGASMKNVTRSKTTAFLNLSCPEEGSFIGFQKIEGYIVKLMILEDSKRSSATSRKCRCDKAKILSIINLDGSESGINEIDGYKIGDIISDKDYNDDRWYENGGGIYFYITKSELLQNKRLYDDIYV